MLSMTRPVLPVRFWTVALALLASACGPARQAGPALVLAGQSARIGAPVSELVPMPNQRASLKFAALGDFGTGARGQYELAAQMAKTHSTFPFEMVILLGDNLYGPERPQDFAAKFETPYKPLLDQDVKFYASLGNHDSREQRYYKLFNMDGKLYYSFKAPAGNVRFFAFESSDMRPEQVQWIEEELKKSNEDWKIAFMHHPLYSSGKRHGSALRLRTSLEPMLVRYNVSVVFAGHDHFYERVTPQQGIVHFVAGSGGQLRSGNIDRTSTVLARGFDTDYAFVVAEISGDQMTFQAIARSGQL